MELSFLMNILTFLANGLILRTIVDCKIVRNWNNCPLQSYAIHIVAHVSLDECLKQCSMRIHCQLICYRARLKLCEIHEAIDSTTFCKSCVSVFHKDIPAEKFGPICGCDEGQTCDGMSGLCDYTECGKLSDPFGVIKGNLARVGDKKIAGCKKGFKGDSTLITCDRYGQWKNLPTCEICPPMDGIINVTDAVRIKIFSHAVTQPEAKGNCNKVCGFLARMNQRNKMTAIRNLIRSSSEFTFEGYWVDGYSADPENRNSWKFSNGAQMSMEEDVFWISHAPNHYIQPACVRLTVGADYLMDDIGCDLKFHYICEM